MNKKTFLYCTFQLEGYHKYPDADKLNHTATGDYLDVSHLALRHFHYFNFKVWVEVKHDNRDIEFIQLRRMITKMYNEREIELDYKSCEMISNDLWKFLSKKYPSSEIRIDVSEEGINGSYTEYDAREQQ